MTNPNLSAPEIAPSQIMLQGENLDVIAYANPDKFPVGLEILVMVPGSLEPIARAHVDRGRLVAVMPITMSRELATQTKQALDTLPAEVRGKIKTPGF